MTGFHPESASFDGLCVAHRNFAPTTGIGKLLHKPIESFNTTTILADNQTTSTSFRPIGCGSEHDLKDMSLPPEILDQLLSGYLDDVLSVDERARVEQLLNDDPSVQTKLEQLQELGTSLKDLDRSTQHRLDDGFADRVLKATVDQATGEGLSEDHPVMMLARQPSVSESVAPKGNAVIWKAASVLTALAASVAVAFVVLNGPDKDKNIAEVQSIEPKSDLVADDTNVSEDIKPEIVVDPKPPIAVPESIEKVADVPAPTPINTESVVAPADLKTTKIAVVDKTPATENPVKIDSNVISSGFVVVLDVKLTEVGHMEDAIRIALKEAKIDAVQSRQIDAGMVAFKKKLGEGIDGAKVLYLEGSAKKLDNFANRLYLDREGVGSIGFNMSFDAPLMNFVSSLKKIDATKIQHVSAWELADDNGNAVSTLVSELTSRNFANVNRDKPNTGLVKMADGQDVPSRIFVIVR